MRKLIMVLALSPVFIWACDPLGVYEQNLRLPNESWHLDSNAVFVATIADTSLVYNVLVNIRSTTSYPNSNLYLFITTHAPTGATQRDTMECFLASETGMWLGKGFGRIRDHQFAYKRNVKFTVAGPYTFVIQHGMRTENLIGIAGAGIRLEQSKRKQ